MTPDELQRRLDVLCVAGGDPVGTVVVQTFRAGEDEPRRRYGVWWALAAHHEDDMHPLECYGHGDTDEAACEWAWANVLRHLRERAAETTARRQDADHARAHAVADEGGAAAWLSLAVSL